ncbi:hypothetical protein JCM8097_005661 [Rhodosporidiobolus ruineniae]
MPRLLTARRTRSAVFRIVLALAALSTLLVAMSGRRLLPPSLVAQELRSARSVLWVVAHPDDESFFFAPSILGLLNQQGVQGALLSLSIGNHDGLGGVRRTELTRSCAVLGISSACCLAVDDPALPDNPDLEWPRAAISSIVKRQLDAWDVDAVVTFDLYGVSGHANHRTVAAAIIELATSDPNFPPSFAVSSTSVLTKFTSLLLLPLVLLRHLLRADESGALFVNSWRQYLETHRSFAAHASQARWFRTLFVTFSRYLWYVELKRIVP